MQTQVEKLKRLKKNIRGNENKTSEVDGKIKYVKKKKESYEEKNC